MFRRTFLQVSSAVAGLKSQLVTNAVASPTRPSAQPHLGQTTFVEAKVEHPDAPAYPRSQGHGKAQYVVEDDVYLTEASPDDFDADSVITTGRTHRAEPEAFDFGPSKYTIPVTRDFRGLGEEYLQLSSEYSWPEVNVEFDGNTVAAAVDGSQQTVPPNDTLTVALSDREIRISDPAQRNAGQSADGERDGVITTQVTPELTIRNHGRVNVFGTNAGPVFPQSPESEYAKHRLQAVRFHPDVSVAATEATNRENTSVNVVSRGDNR